MCEAPTSPPRIEVVAGSCSSCACIGLGPRGWCRRQRKAKDGAAVVSTYDTMVISSSSRSRPQLGSEPQKLRAVAWLACSLVGNIQQAQCQHRRREALLVHLIFLCRGKVASHSLLSPLRSPSFFKLLSANRGTMFTLGAYGEISQSSTEIYFT